ncbi:hypothetical protein K1719_040575 [Acacia pycnantha]|nr:hypothetical protein K1719_040575 [Acacia pycnantha]
MSSQAKNELSVAGAHTKDKFSPSTLKVVTSCPMNVPKPVKALSTEEDDHSARNFVLIEDKDGQETNVLVFELGLVRALALACINFGGYKLHPYPLLDLSILLRMKESDLESLCNACGLETRTDESGNKNALDDGNKQA